MDAAMGGLNLLFGRGVDDQPFWLLAVRIDILIFVIGGAAALWWYLREQAAPATRRVASIDVGLALALTVLAGALRFAAEHNLSDLGGIGYSRILLGYKGHYGAAQLYSLIYPYAGRDLDTAILLNRIASTLTVALVYALCRLLMPATRSFALLGAGLMALHPLNVLFAATDALPPSTSLVAAAAYLLLALAVEDPLLTARRRATVGIAAGAGFALLTQIRYENLLFLAPVAVYLWRRRGALRRDLALGTAVFAVCMAAFVVEAARAGSSFHTPIRMAEVLPGIAREVFGNPIFALVPAIVGSLAALLMPRSRVRLFALLPLLAVFPLIGMTSSTDGHHLARTYVNEILLVVLMASYGLTLLWESGSRVAQTIAVACVLWSAALPALFMPILRERHLETVEHDFFRTALASLPPGIDRIIVPDDEILRRQTGSTIEYAQKYQMIAAAAGAGDLDLVGMTRFLEDPAVDCRRGNCLIFRGVPCMGIARYWFAEPTCTQLMATRAGPAVLEEEVVAGSFADCSVSRGAARARACDPVRRAQRFGLYRVKDAS